MKRHYVTALFPTLALALALTVPTGALARAEVVGMSGLGCCVDLGVRLSINFEGTSIRGAVVFPRLETEVGDTESAEATELIGFAVGTADVILWGAPVVRAIAAAVVNALASARGEGSSDLIVRGTGC